MSLEGATRRLVHLWSQTLGPVQRVFFPRSPPEHPCPPPAPLEYANILGSISEDPVLISELSRLAASEDSSPSADLAIPVGYTVLDKLYVLLNERRTYPVQNMIKGLLLRLIHGGHSQQLPSSLYLDGVEFHSMDDVIFSGSANIYRGSNANGLLALKHLRSFTSATPTGDSVMDELAHEVIIWSHLDHPHIVPLLGVVRSEIEDHPGCFMVSPWMKEGSLSLYMEKLHGHQYPEFLKRATGLLHHISQAIEYIHAHGVVHGDIRGANILIDGEDKAYLSDFGSATLVGVHNYRDIKRRKGNTRSCAPELHTSAEEPSFPCDVYSFAMLCIEVFLRRPLFEGWKEPTIIMEIANRKRTPPIPRDTGHPMPKELEALVDSCRQNCPSKRPTISEVVERMRVISEKSSNFDG
ncbi:hypothetical protein NLI96_g5195 [Meripilus lineatus]|uniref:Protein kinase domain-containing protein n=1 Tax=Meripilus lineatus TaxID=2056292 RepID=A0AAD5V3X9_9APHY|nr:hypothetical protein NLI96_g5195 [Physisporinus lineatus]